MSLTPSPEHDLSALDIDWIEDQIYAHNRRAIGRDDALGLAFMFRDEGGRMIGACAGYSWAGTAELKQLWVDPAYRGRGYGRMLLDAFIAEASRRGVAHIWVASYDFQAPEFYEAAGFVRMAEFTGWPEGHSNIIFRLAMPPGVVG